MHKPKSINELLNTNGKRLAAIKIRAEARKRVLDIVRDTLPPALAAAVVSAGLERGRLTVGVTGAGWASRLRYSAEALRTRVGTAVGEEITSVRSRVVPPPA